MKMTPEQRQYFYVHQWLAKTFGRASQCEFCHKEKPRYTYALKKEHQHDFKRENYLELCYSCHRSFDITEETKRKAREFMTGRISARRKPILQLKDGKIIQTHDSITIAAQVTGYCKDTISKHVRGLFIQSRQGFQFKYKEPE